MPKLMPPAAARRQVRRLWLGFAMNAACAGANALGAAALCSLWMGVLAFYYLVLSALRLYLLRGYRQNDRRTAWRKYRAGAVAMLLLALALAGIFCATALGGHTIQYPGHLIYAVAAYTFYAVARAVRGAVSCRGAANPRRLGGAALDLAAAVISVYMLQSAMVSAFGEEDTFKTVMDRCVGAAALAVLVGLSAAMIAKGTKQMRRSGAAQT